MPLNYDSLIIGNVRSESRWRQARKKGYMYEHRRKPVIPRREFFRRMGRHAVAALLLVAVSWLIGILGYRILEKMSWADSMLNAAMILGGMGPVNPLQTDAGKLFASI